MMMAAPELVQTSLIWLTYAVAVGVALAAALITAFSWQASRERSPLVSAVTVLSLTALLATLLLLPVDVALVSSTGSATLGTKYEWATPDRIDRLITGLRIAYYCLYSLDTLLCLVVVPFAYFWYEEYDEIEIEEGGRSVASRVFAAAKYTIFFVFLAASLFLLGFFIPAASGPHHHRPGDGDDRRNSPLHWDLDYFRRLLSENRGEQALTFAIGLLITVGTLLHVVYASTGLALLPISLIKSAPSISAPQLSATTATALEQNRERQRRLELRNSNRSPAEPMPHKDQRELDALKREELTLVRRERLAAEALGDGRGSLYRAWVRVCAVLRPIKLLGGLVLGIVSALVWVSILITGIDKAANSMCRGRCGYVLAHVGIFQPTNWLFGVAARAFPADYVLLALLVLFLFSAAAYGLGAVGIRFLWVRVFRISKGRTAPQALLIATVMLGLLILALNYTVSIMLAPQYATFGTQTFCTLPGPISACALRPDAVVACAETLRDIRATTVCTPTVMSTLLNRTAAAWPFFGAVLFWAQFAFLAVTVLVAVTACFRTPRLNLADIDRDIEADEEESLLAATRSRLDATWQDITGRPAANQGDQQQEHLDA